MRNFYILSFLLIFFSGNLLAQTKAAPTTQLTSLEISNLSQTQFDLTWTRGDGSACIVVVYQGLLGVPTVADATTYAADAAFGSGDECGTGWFCVYNGTGTTVTVTGLAANTHYLVYGYEYNGAAGAEEYLVSGGTNFGYTYTLPTLFTVSGGGSYCEGVSPTDVDVTLSGSETGVNYQLKKDGVDEGIAVAGTGSPLVWVDLFAGTYTIVAENLSGSATMTGNATIVENALPDVSFTGLYQEYCIDADTVTLVPGTPGGTFSGNGMDGNFFVPADAGAGHFYINYSLTDGNGCSNIDSSDVTIYALPVVSFTGLDTAYCFNADTVMLVADSTGSVFSGNGIDGDYFIPADAGAGIQTITVTYTDTHGCIGTSQQETEVIALPVITLDTLYSVCDTAFTLDAGAGFDSYLWSTGDTTQTITLNADTTVMVTVTDAFGCMNSSETEVSFSGAISLVAADTIHSCNGANVTLSITGTAGTIVWNSTDTVSTITVSPITAEYYYVELISGNCSANDSILVMPHDYPTATLPATVNACGSTVLNPGSSNVTYLWTGGVTTSTLTVTASGTYNVTVTNQWGCTATATSAVTISPAPNVNLGNDITLALNQTIVIGVTGGYTSYLWSTGATSNTITITGSTLGVGQHEIWIAAEMSNGCSSSDTMIVTVTWTSDVSSNTENGIFSAYPNPASDKVFVTNERGDVADEISLYNIVGENLFTELRTNILNVSDVPSGIYTLIIKSGNSTPVRKTIVIKK